MDRSVNAGINKIYGEIARENSVTPESVKAEIQAAISFAASRPEKNFKDFWRQIPVEGEEPELLDLILFIAANLRSDE